MLRCGLTTALNNVPFSPLPNCLASVGLAPSLRSLAICCQHCLASDDSAAHTVLLVQDLLRRCGALTLVVVSTVLLVLPHRNVYSHCLIVSNYASITSRKRLLFAVFSFLSFRTTHTCRCCQAKFIHCSFLSFRTTRLLAVFFVPAELVHCSFLSFRTTPRSCPSLHPG